KSEKRALVNLALATKNERAAQEQKKLADQQKQAAVDQKKRAEQDEKNLAVALSKQKEATARANANEKIANDEKEHSDRVAYIANMNILQSEWESGKRGSVLSRLEETRNYKERGFEWGYWNLLCHPYVKTRTLRVGSSEFQS